MPRHFEREIDKLKRVLFALCGSVEEIVGKAALSVERRDAALAQAVMDSDPDIDDMEVNVEEECLKILALHQPVATDLRFVVAVLKINNDLERIGDLAVNIAERSAFLASNGAIAIPSDIPAMARLSQHMLRSSIDCLVNMDADLAREVRARDDEVDALNRAMFAYVKERIQADLENLDPLIHLLSVSRHIERIADLATNIAEDVIYMVEGEIVRHRTEDYLAPGQ